MARHIGDLLRELRRRSVAVVVSFDDEVNLASFVAQEGLGDVVDDDAGVKKEKKRKRKEEGNEEGRKKKKKKKKEKRNLQVNELEDLLSD